MTHKTADQAITLDPPRVEMVGYIKTAIGEGYQPEHEGSVADLNVIDSLGDNSLNREFGKCWQWYNMGGGFHETFDKNKTHYHACVNCFTDKGPCLGECNITDSNKKLASFEEASKPLIKWLAENVHPHHTVIVTSTGAELMMGEMSFPTEEFLKD